MSRQRKRQFRFATFIILPAVLLLAALVPALMSSKASALSTPQWEIVRGYINSYFGGTQYNAATDGEAGFRMGKVDLWNRLDSNGDIAPNAGPSPAVGSAGTAVTGVVSEGDDMANRPVLIDNLKTQTGIIPGTEFRCNYNTNEDCFADTSISAIRQIVDNHKAAGFSTDIVDYCVSSQTAGPSTGGFGIIAQVPGALSSDTSLIPRVYNVDYSRNGWRNALSVANGTDPVAAPETSAGGFAAPGTVADCNASTTDYELVRCQANWAIASTGGNVGNGQMTNATSAAAGQTIDVRNGASINTMSTANPNLQIPINTLFTTSSLANINPLVTSIVVSRTQMGATNAIGLRMLGYPLVTGGSVSTGISRWNGAEGEDQVAYGDGLPLQTVAAAATGPVDTTGPSVSSVSHTNVTHNSADIERTAGEPATLKVEYGTATGVYTNTVNDTVLNAVKDVAAGNGNAAHLTGLTEYTHYYYRVTSYDGYANGTVSAEGNFWTADITDPVTTNNSTLGWHASPYNITLSCTDTGGSGCGSTTWRVDGGSWQTGTSVAVSGTGTHSVEYYSTDVAGNIETINSISANVDATAPATTDNAPAGWEPGAVSVTLSCTDGHSGCDYTTYELDGGATQTGNSVLVPGTTGTHTINYRSYDAAGNVETPDQQATVNVDVTLPVIQNNLPTGTTGNTGPTITANYTDAHSGINTSTIVVTLNGIAETDCTVGSGTVSCPTSGLTDGTYNVVVSVNDNVGNGASLPWSFTVNTAAPVIDPPQAPLPGTWTSDNTPTVTMNYHASGTIDAASLTIDGTLCASAVWNQYSISCTPAALTDGTHSVHGSVSVGANEATLDWTFQVDTTAPATTDNAPAGWQNAPFTVTLSCDDTPGSGCASTKLDVFTVNLAECPLWVCSDLPVPGDPLAWGTGSTVPITTEGFYVISYFGTDALGNFETPFNRVDAKLDLTDPTAANVLPTGIIANDSPTISFEANDALSGLDTSQLSVSLDTVLMDTCTQSGANPITVSCTTSGLTDGEHAIQVSAHDDAGNIATNTGTFTVDTMAPTATNISPAGNVNDANPVIEADILDPSGVLPLSVVVWLDGTQMTGCTTSDITGGIHVSCPASGLLEGEHSITFGASDTVNNNDSYLFTFNVVFEITYYFPWYDNNAAAGMNGDWLMITNRGSEAAAVDVYVGDELVQQYDGPGIGGDNDIQPGALAVWQQQAGEGVITNGPVKIVSRDGQELMVSQRVLFKDSFNEILAVNEENLDNDYYFTWYDNNPAWGMNGNWILAANTGTSATDISIYVGDVGDAATPVATFTGVAPGAHVEWQSPTTITGGPVRVKSTGQNILVSQRVIYMDAFNEVLGAGKASLDTEGYFTWYDNNAAWGMNRNWVLATNVGTQETTVEIYVDGGTEADATFNNVAVGQTVAWESPTTLTAGPVRVLSTNAQTLMTSQRVLYKNSFEEIQGTKPADMLAGGAFNWYDSMIANGMNGDWLLISNITNTQKSAHINIGGDDMTNPDTANTTFPVAGFASIAPSFGNLMSGPVNIACPYAAPGEMLMSQRVIFKDSFNELVSYPVAPA